MNNEKGITLVEVMSCLVVVSVLAGFAIPTIETFKSKLSLNGEVSRMVSELHKARLYAITHNSFVVFTYSDHGYKTFIDDGSGGGNKQDWVRQSGEQLLSDVTFSERILIDTSQSSFTSHRTRFSTKPGVSGGTVVLTDNKGHSKKVVVNSVGRVRVEKI